MNTLKENKVIFFMDKTFDLFFIILTISSILLGWYELFVFLYSTLQSLLNDKLLSMSLFLKTWLDILILVKFYKILKDYIGEHHIKLRNLAEIWIVSLLSKLIFQIDEFSVEEILIRLLLLVVMILFFYIEIFREEKKICQDD